MLLMGDWKNTKMIIRKYRKEDAKAVCEIIKLNDLKVTSKDYPKKLIKVWIKGDTPEWIEKISNKTKCFVLIEKKKVIGYISLKKNEINKLFIHPSYQGKGYGKKLMDKAISIVRRRGVKTIKLYSNLGAKGFYSKCGFNMIKKVRRSSNGVNYYCFLMKKKIE